MLVYQRVLSLNTSWPFYLPFEISDPINMGGESALAVGFTADMA
jgi:hypothetical protein